jgi:hypothetical protein
MVCSSLRKWSKQATHLEQQGADDLLSDAKRSVVSEAVMPMVDLF